MVLHLQGMEILCQIARRFYCVVFSSVITSSYTIVRVVRLSDMFDYPNDNVFIFVRVVVARLTRCTVLAYVKFWACRCCYTLSLAGYRSQVSHPVNENCVWYTIFLTGGSVVLYAHNAERFCRPRLMLVIRYPR